MLNILLRQRITYARDTYRYFCELSKVVPSASQRRNCHDNRNIKSWSSSMKKERIYRRKHRSEDELRAIVFFLYRGVVNKHKTYSALAYLSPKEFKELTLLINRERPFFPGELHVFLD